MLLRSAFKLLSPAGRRGRLSVLMFHRVLGRPDPLFPEAVDARRFDEICSWLGAWFNVVALDDAVQRLRSGTLPERALAITFDDGYADNHDVALPILTRYGFASTFFIATSFLDGGRMWNDTVIESIRRTSLASIDLRGVCGMDLGVHPLLPPAAKRAAIDRIVNVIKYVQPLKRQSVVEDIAERAETSLPDNLMMTSDQVRRMRRAGMQIGAHTVTHPILARLDRSAARHEIEASKQTLESLLGEPVSLFAYPNGKPMEDYNEESVDIAREAGFEAAVSTAWGSAGPGCNLFSLPRFTPWDTARLMFAARLASNLCASRR